MYIHLGGDYVVKESEVIGIFDLDTSTVSKHTRDFLSKKEKEKKVVYTSYELPKSFILTTNKKQEKIYISQISSQTLEKRSGIIVK